LVVVSFIGGLGNQLFQYAVGRKVSIAQSELLFFDKTSYLNDYYNRKLSIGCLNVRVKNLPDFVAKKFFTPHTKMNRLIKKLSLLDERFEENFSYKPQVLSTKKIITYLNGYWQSYKYFQDIRDVLLTELVTNSKNIEQLKAEISFNASSVSIHIRRKDYLNDERYGFLGLSYYLNAIEFLNKKMNGAHFFVFSDDIEWCKLNLKIEEKVTYISGQFNLSDWEELMVMSYCSHHIIANSSFSWWGAWLCRNPNQIVIRPRKPFKDSSLLYEHYYPENWTSLD
jgi:hypothetical protein